jgi:hypothetical protein
MPVKKLRLNAAEARQTSSHLTHLCAEGVALGIDSEMPAPEVEARRLEITQYDLGILCDRPPLNPIYVLPLSIVARTSTVVEDCLIEVPWEDGAITLPYLREREGFYKIGSVSYPTREVLNDYFDPPFTMNRGAILRGVILAYGCQQIPEEARERNVSVRFTVIDTLGREATAEIRCVLERSATARSSALPQRNTSEVPAQNDSTGGPFLNS